MYTHDPDVISFASRGRVTVSHFYLADDPIRAARSTRASRVAYLAPETERRSGFEDSLAAAGIRFEREDTPLGPLLTGFRLEPAGFREIPPAGWTATASLRPELAGHAIDRDAGTRWRTTGRPADAWLQVDLGRVHPVGMVAWLPGSYQEVPLGFRLDTSTDGTRWTVAREVPVYYGPLYWAAGHPMGRVRWGRVEARFPGRPARYVRLTHLGRDERFPWTVRELFVYETGDATGEPGSTRARLPERSSRWAPGASTRITEKGRGSSRPRGTGSSHCRTTSAWTATAWRRRSSGSRSSSRRRTRPSCTRRGRRRGRRSRPRSGPPAWASPPPTWAATGSSAGSSRRPSSGRIARVAAARVTAEPAGGDPRAATDGRAETRWSTRAPQVPGQWLQVELEAPAELGGLELDLGGAALEYPRGLAVQVARDAGWEDVDVTIRWVGPLVWTGTHVLRAGVERVVVDLSLYPGARAAGRPDRPGRVPPVVGRRAAPARALTRTWDQMTRARTERRVRHRS